MVSPMHQLLGRSSGFEVAATQKPCTKGLWMWSAPIKRTAADGSEYNLILLDSEGIDSYDQTVSLHYYVGTNMYYIQNVAIKHKVGPLRNLTFTKMFVAVRNKKDVTTVDTACKLRPF
jgi:hypothetical protein